LKVKKAIVLDLLAKTHL